MSKIFASINAEGGLSTTSQKKRNNLFHFVTYDLNFRNKSQAILFEDHQIAQSNSVIFLITQILVSLYITSKFDVVHHFTQLGIINLGLALCSPLVCGWLLVFLKQCSQYSTTVRQRRRIIFWLRNFWVIGVSVALYLDIFTISHNGSCSPERKGYFQRFGCSYGGQRQMPEDKMLISLMWPAVLMFIVREVRWEAVYMSFVLSVFSSLFCIFYFDLTQSLMLFLFCLPFSLGVMYEVRRQQIDLFLLSESLMEEQGRVLSDREVKSEAAHNQRIAEMRHMVGNLAHDLKTPLSAFNGNVEMLLGATKDLQRRCEGGSCSPKSLCEGLSLVVENVDSMQNINTFMLMTINRCIDYTKAAEGVKLKACLETVSLSEALRLPMFCMRDMSAKLSLRLRPLSPLIVDLIITDKQWLQENLLCLLSNASKYSSHGEITVTVSLMDVVGTSDQVVNVTQQDNTSAVSSRKEPFFSPDLTITVDTSDTSPLNTPTGKHVGVNSFSGSFLTVQNGISDATPLPRGSLSIVTSPHAASKRATLRIEVEDTGIGMSDEAMAALFQPFKQAQRLAGGTGLGLYSLAKRMEALDGTFGVQRRQDGAQGSMFWFEIPYRPDNSSSLRSPTQRIHATIPEKDRDDSRSSSNERNSTSIRSKYSVVQAGVGSSGGSPKHSPVPLHILLVDDSLTIVKMSSMLLRRQGHSVTTAENGFIALDKISTRMAEKPHSPFDVVLMDLQMPVMDGLEATRRLREREAIAFGVLEADAQAAGETLSVAEGVRTTPRLGGPYEIQAVGGETTRRDDNKSFVKIRSGGLAASSFDSPRVVGPSIAVLNVVTNSPTRLHVKSPTASKGGAHRRSYCQLVIGVSANSDTDMVAEAFDAGVDAFIPKPFTLQSFNDVYAKLLAQEESNEKS